MDFNPVTTSSDSASASLPVLRVARAASCLQAVPSMYQAGLGLERLGGFEDHEGFSGVMLGHQGSPYHLEFTQGSVKESLPHPHKETLLVFYVQGKKEWTARCQAMEGAGFKAVSSHNPYWDKVGKTFEDPDGYRVVIQEGIWPPV